MESISIVLYIFSLSFGIGTIFISFKISKSYRVGYLSHYLYLLICFNILAFLKLILTYFAPRLVGKPFNETIENLHILLLFLIFPIIPMCIYFFVKFVFGFFERELSKIMTRGYVLFWIIMCAGFAIGIRLKLEKMNMKLLRLMFLVYLLAVLIFLILIFIKALFFLKNSTDRHKKKAFRIFISIYILCFVLYALIFLFFSSPYSGSPVEYLSLFAIHLPPIFYLKFFLKNYYLTHPIEKRSLPNWEIFSAKYGISAREVEIIRLLTAGKSNKDIEEELFISIKTVKNHIFNIYKKTRIKNRIQLINLVHNFQEDK